MDVLNEPKKGRRRSKADTMEQASHGRSGAGNQTATGSWRSVHLASRVRSNGGKRGKGTAEHRRRDGHPKNRIGVSGSQKGRGRVAGSGGKANTWLQGSRSGHADPGSGGRSGGLDSRVDGLALINGENLYHFEGCGLDYVWLYNGFEYRDTQRGRVVRIRNLDGLHAAIARWVVNNPNKLRGQEVRFLRSMLGVSQEGLGKLLGQSRASVARWEGNRNKAIPPGSDHWLRVVYTKKAEGDTAVCQLVDLLTKLDEIKHGKSSRREARFADGKIGWRETPLLVANCG